MILAALTVLLIASCACSLIVVDHMLGAESDRFPCAHPAVRWSARVTAFFFFVRAAMLFSALRHFDTSWWAPEMLGASASLSALFASICWMLIRSRLPRGVWPRLQRRVAAVRVVARYTSAPRAAQLAAEGATTTEILKADGATAVPPGAGPEALLSAGSTR